jgi:cytochrome b
VNNVIKVWDWPVRLFHWLLVAAFLTAYFTEDDLLELHVWAGYGVMGLLAFRIVWGFIGNSYARFKNFVCSPAASFAYLKAVLFAHPKRYVGHNPAGAAMIVLMLLGLLLTACSGLIVYAADQGLGPLAGFIPQAENAFEEFWEETHEFIAHFTLFLIVLHVLGVFAESVMHKENLVKAMLHGYKRADDESDANSGNDT